MVKHPSTKSTNGTTNQIIVALNTSCLVHISTNRRICQGVPLQISLASYRGSTSTVYSLYPHGIHFHPLSMCCIANLSVCVFRSNHHFGLQSPNLTQDQFWIVLVQRPRLFAVRPIQPPGTRQGNPTTVDCRLWQWLSPPNFGQPQTHELHKVGYGGLVSPLFAAAYITIAHL